jgi:hypothetical protein
MGRGHEGLSSSWPTGEEEDLGVGDLAKAMLWRREDVTEVGEGGIDCSLGGDDSNAILGFWSMESARGLAGEYLVGEIGILKGSVAFISW